VYCVVSGKIEACICQVGGDGTWAERGCRPRQAGERWAGRIKNVVFLVVKGPQFCINCYVGK